MIAALIIFAAILAPLYGVVRTAMAIERKALIPAFAWGASAPLAYFVGLYALSFTV